VLLEPFDTAQSHKAYVRVLREWEAAGRCLPPHSAEGSAKPDLSINELCLAYWRHAVSYYIKEGKATSEQHAIKCALRFVHPNSSSMTWRITE
jgi:hypothetical protein